MYHYEFPIIHTLDDILPAIEGREEFFVAERDFGYVVNYQVVMNDSFPPVKVAGGSQKMREERARMNALRRECRGIIFDRDRKIMSRPFHKFFNVGEREETLPRFIQMNRPHVILEKMDGSMIRPIIQDGELRLATKMGVTDIAIQAEKWMNSQGSHLKETLFAMVVNGITPLFEWVSPENQIVVRYEKPDLVYLGSRENVSGKYFFEDVSSFTSVQQYGSVNSSLEEYIEKNRHSEKREGDIIRFEDGHMLKMKNDWYVRLHKTLDQVRFDRNIVELILHEQFDDVVSMLPEEEMLRLHEFEKKFWEAFNSRENYLKDLLEQVIVFGTDRKRIALDFIPKLEDKREASMVFKLLDGNDPRVYLLELVQKNINTNSKWDEFKGWFYK